VTFAARFFGRVLFLELVTVLGILLTLDSSQAQVTSITSSGLGTTVSQAGTTWNITGGTRVGSNLFESFGLFNVGASDTANFNNTSGLATTNILGRVTGGQPSNILGKIQTTNFGAANLFLINPAGWMFGPNASLNVGGAFRASTANYVSFPDLADGTKVRFAADTSPLPASGLTANPTAFGFLGPNFAGITVQGSRLQVTTGQTLSLTGGGIQIAGGALLPTLGATGGRVEVASVASAGEVSVNDLSVTSPTLGQINISNNARVDVSGISTGSGSAAGTVVIRGGQLFATGSSIFANTTGSANGAELGIDVQAQGDVVLSGATLRVVAQRTGNAGAIQISTPGNLQMQSAALIDTQSLGGVAGDISKGVGGDVLLNVGGLSLTGGARITSTTQRAGASPGGPGGNLLVTATGPVSISGQNSGLISTTAANASSGVGGRVEITSPSSSLTLDAGGSILTRSLSVAGGGDVTLQASNFSMTNGATIVSRTSSNGAGGNVAVTATDTALISGAGAGIFSGASSGALSNTSVGDISLNAGKLTLTDGAQIQNGSVIGRTGDLTIATTDSIAISNGAGISSQAFGEDVGQATISAASLLIDNGFISTSTIGGGRAGDISVDVGTLTLANGGQIASSSALSAAGAGGSLSVTATGPVSISGQNPTGSSSTPFFSGELSSGLFSQATGTGAGGRITVDASALSMDNLGKISVATKTGSSGDAGNVSLNVGTVDFTGGARVDSSTEGAGHGGSLALTAANSVSISGSGTGLFSTASSTGNAGQITVSTTTLAMGNDSMISVATLGAGNAGNTLLNVSNLSLTGGAQVVSSTDGIGQGGSVTVNAPNSISISGSGSSPSGLFSTASSTGNAGQITVSTPTLAMGDGGTISVATSGAGNAGNIALNVSNFTQTGGARVDSSTSGSGSGGDLVVTAANSTSISGSGTGLFSTASSTGPGGDIKVQSPQVQVLDGATISANSTGTETATAGNVNIVTSDLNMQNGSITTEATLADGGNISITTTGSLVHLTDSQITTSVHSGVGSGGNITINSDLVVLEDSQILANAFGGPGGNIDITADVFLVNSGGMVPLSLKGIVDASSTLSTPGVINIEATFTNVTGSVTLLPETPLKATELLRAACAARFAGGKTSSLVVGGRDGIPLQPGDLSPSPLYLAGDAGTPSTGNSVTGQELPTRFSLLGSKDRLSNQYSLLPNVRCAL
jgi:filamentous hemagglutinin family protein